MGMVSPFSPGQAGHTGISRLKPQFFCEAKGFHPYCFCRAAGCAQATTDTARWIKQHSAGSLPTGQTILNQRG